MIARELKEFRARHGLSRPAAGLILGMHGESFRLREIGRYSFTAAELARLAESQGETIQEAFPSYQLTDSELALIRQLSDAA